MAALRGTVQGSRGQASRLGSRTLVTHADTWRTFTTTVINKDGSGWMTVRRDGKVLIHNEWGHEGLG